MANQPATPNRVIRIPDELWDEAQVIADERGENMSEYVRRLIREDVRRWPGGHPGTAYPDAPC